MLMPGGGRASTSGLALAEHGADRVDQDIVGERFLKDHLVVGVKGTLLGVAAGYVDGLQAMPPYLIRAIGMPCGVCAGIPTSASNRSIRLAPSTDAMVEAKSRASRTSRPAPASMRTTSRRKASSSSRTRI
jgi:hypothetical protein